jgi:hypothetical protein
MSQYAQSDSDSLPQTPHSTASALEVRVQPKTIEFQWDGKQVQVPHPQQVQDLFRECSRLNQELQELKMKHQKLQQQHVSLAQIVLQLQKGM